MSKVARRVALVPLDEATEDAVAEAALGVPGALDGQPVAVGDEVATEPVRFLVEGTDPLGGARVDLDVTHVTIRPDALPEPKPVVDVLLLADASWTMGKGEPTRTRYDRAYHAIEIFLRNAGDLVHHVALGTFTRDVAVLTDAAPAGDVNVRALDPVEPRGRTDLAAALGEGVAHLRRLHPPDHVHALLVVTDGPGVDTGLAQAVKRAARLGVRVFVLDVGDEPNRILEKACKVTRGGYRHGPDAPTFAFAAHALAEAIDAPLDWDEPPFDNGDGTRFDVVLRARPPQKPDAPGRRREHSP